MPSSNSPIQKSFLSGIIWLFSLTPYWVLYRVADLLYLFFYYIFRYRRKVVRENLLLAFPEKSDNGRKKIEKKFYSFLADLLLESLKLRSISKKTVKKRFSLSNEELIHRYLNQQTPVMCMTGHYGNWEFGLHRLSLMTNKPVLIVYKPLSNKIFESIYNAIRTRFHAVLVPMKQTLREILRYKDTPHISMFVSDQTPTLQESRYFTSFFGRPTLVFEGLEKIARKTNFPVVYCRIDRVKRGYYSCTFEPIMENPAGSAEHELTDLHTQHLEKIIRQKPELWLWSHRRWKHKAPTPHDEKKG